MWARMSSRGHFFHFLISCMQLLLNSYENNKYLIYENFLSNAMNENNSNYSQYFNLLIISVSIVDIKDTKVNFFSFISFFRSSLTFTNRNFVLRAHLALLGFTRNNFKLILKVFEYKLNLISRNYLNYLNIFFNSSFSTDKVFFWEIGSKILPMNFG